MFKSSTINEKPRQE